MKRWIATVTVTTDAVSLVEEQEFTGDVETCEVLYQFGWIKPYDDTLPRPPKGVAVYEIGLPYPNDRLVVKDGALYLSNVGAGNYTSMSWILAEWDLQLQGV